MLHGEEARPREASGSGPVRIWGWWWDRRNRVADWLYACGLFPLIAVANAIPVESGLGVGNRLWVAVDSMPLPVDLLLAGTSFLLLPALYSGAVLLRRSRPAWLLSAGLVLFVVLGNVPAICFALYSYAAWFTDRRRLAAWTVATAAGMLVVHPLSEPTLIFSWLFWNGMVALAVTVGLWVGTRRELIANLRERAERLERERYLEAERASAAERTRIAREMHDVVAHRVSLMVLHAGGLEVSAADERTAETAALIRGTGREALAELREILGVLREDPEAEAEAVPQPVLADLDRLIGDWREAGMAVERRTTGDVRGLPVRLERTAYRVVQEALTNAAKHAPGAAVTVRLDYGAADLDVAVANEPPPPGAARAQPPPSSGYGLTGLRERLAMVGGTLTAGPYPDGGWHLRANVALAQPEEGEAG